MIFETFPVGPLQCNCTIIGDERTGEAIVVDGGDGVDDVVQRLAGHNLSAKLLIHTHAHIDHIGDLGALRERTGNARALLNQADLPLYQELAMQAQWIGLYTIPPIVKLDGDLRDGDLLTAGNIRLEVLHTPGHTPGSVCFAIHGENTAAEQFTLLTGDTLFAGSIGRWDLGGTSMEDIVASIHRKLMDYNDATSIIPGHGRSSTIGEERRSNPYLQRQ